MKALFDNKRRIRDVVDDLCFINNSGKKRLLDLLSDGQWHRVFSGIGLGTFILMQERGFTRVRYINKSSWKTGSGGVEARITSKGGLLLKHGHYENKGGC